MRMPVLDHGYVELDESCGSDEKVIRAARKSLGKGFVDWGRDSVLLRRLWMERHTSPFEHSGATFNVYAPILVYREWHRHRTQSYSEFSARFAKMPDVHYLPSKERVGMRRKKNLPPIPDHIVGEFLDRIEREQQMIYETYSWAIDQGIDREIARINTPISRYSEMMVSANLLNWLRFLGLRMPEGVQWETQQYAWTIFDVVAEVFPRTWALFAEDYEERDANETRRKS